MSIYDEMIKTTERPLEYIEITENKPLIVKLNDKWYFKSHLHKANHFIKFTTMKNLVFNNLEKINETETDDKNIKFVCNMKIFYFKLLINLLYDISKDEYPKYKQKAYKKFLDVFLLDDIEKLFEIVKIVIDYNTKLKKKQKFLTNINIFENSACEGPTYGGVSLNDLIRTDEQGNPYFLN